MRTGGWTSRRERSRTLSGPTDAVRSVLGPVDERRAGIVSVALTTRRIALDVSVGERLGLPARVLAGVEVASAGRDEADPVGDTLRVSARRERFLTGASSLELTVLSSPFVTVRRGELMPTAPGVPAVVTFERPELRVRLRPREASGGALGPPPASSGSAVVMVICAPPAAAASAERARSLAIARWMGGIMVAGATDADGAREPRPERRALRRRAKAAAARAAAAFSFFCLALSSSTRSARASSCGDGMVLRVLARSASREYGFDEWCCSGVGDVAGVCCDERFLAEEVGDDGGSACARHRDTIVTFCGTIVLLSSSAVGIRLAGRALRRWLADLGGGAGCGFGAAGALGATARPSGASAERRPPCAGRGRAWMVTGVGGMGSVAIVIVDRTCAFFFCRTIQREMSQRRRKPLPEENRPPESLAPVEMEQKHG